MTDAYKRRREVYEREKVERDLALATIDAECDDKRDRVLRALLDETGHDPGVVA